MSRFNAKGPSKEMIVRIIADSLLINVALLSATCVRFFYIIQLEDTLNGAAPKQIFWLYLIAYLKSALPLTLICLTVFYFFGFYTYGRSYRGPYKLLIILQAASLSYLIFGFLSYFIIRMPNLPRSVLILGWIFTVALLCLARFYAKLYANVVRAERYFFQPAPKRKVQNVLVIGGAGYIGSAVLSKLLHKGYRLRVLDLLVYGTEPIQHILHHRNLDIMQADFRHVDKVAEAMRGIDAVIHLGAIVGDPACALDEKLTVEINLMATRMISEVAKGAGVNRFIFASTCSVYGASDEILDERSALNPVSLYARSKIASEQVLIKMANTNFAPTILRFGTIYGLSGRTRFDLVINLLTAKALQESQITIFGGGQWRPFLHVDDAALSVVKVLEAPIPIIYNQVFNVGSDQQNCTIRQVGEIVHRFVPNAQIIDKGSDVDRRNYRVNFGKIRKSLDFMPNWSIEQGVEQVKHAIEIGAVKDYRDAKYSNVKFLMEEGPSSLYCLNDDWAYQMIEESSSGFDHAAEVPLVERTAIDLSDNVYEFWFRTVRDAERIDLNAISLKLYPAAFGANSLPDFSWENGNSKESDVISKRAFLSVEIPLASNGNYYGTLRIKKLMNYKTNNRFVLKHVEQLRRRITFSLEGFAVRARECPEVMQNRRRVWLQNDGGNSLSDNPNWDGLERRKFG